MVLRQPPGQDDIASRLAKLERMINEQSRSFTQGPICVVRLNSDSALAAGTAYTPVTSWKPTAEKDPAGMYHYNQGGATYWQIPQPGTYRIVYHVIWSAFGVFNVNKPPWVAQAVLLGPSATPTEICTAVTENLGSDDGSAPLTHNILTMEDRAFATGDVLRFNMYTRYGGTVLKKDPGSDCYTHVVISYVGPS